MPPAFHARRKAAKAIWLLFFFAFAIPAEAHIARSVVAFLDLRRGEIALELVMPVEALDAQSAHPLLLDAPASVEKYGAELGATTTRLFYLTGPGGLAWPCTLTAPLSASPGGETELAKVTALFRCAIPSGEDGRHFDVHDDLFSPTQLSPAALLFARSDWQRGVFSDRPELLGAVSSETRVLHVDRQGGSAWLGFRGVILLGIRHILEGVDHLLFLFMLLLPAPLLCEAGRWRGPASARQAWLRIAAVVSSFTVGHSMTLALGSLGFIHLPSRWIEVLIAVSVLVSALNAIRPIFAHREWIVAIFFGLIHGLAFSTTLADLGLRGGELAVAVLGFNLGIEAMQLFLVLLTMPALVFLAARGKPYRYLRLAGASFGVFASVTWILQRAFEIALPIQIGN